MRQSVLKRLFSTFYHKKRQVSPFLFLTLFLSITVTFSQTTFTENAAAYGLNIGGNKDGGHAWADYDLDGDFDLVINTTGVGYLLRNDGGSFSDQTAALAPDFSVGTHERTALFADFNNDGYPDIFRNTFTSVKIYLQDPITNRFGDGLGGTLPNQIFTALADGQNTEGAGALDYDGDGDLDLFVDNHNFGIDILQNDGAGNFTHVTRKIDSPNPPYNVLDPTTWPLGLVQDATDGDYGSATDFNNDGWVDIVVRKRDQVDLFTNLGGTFQNGVNIDQAANANKGSVGFYDFDNDGDFDLFWTENGTNQIHRNNGDGTWTGIGFAITGIPASFTGQMEGLACGDVDNDGDIDIYLGNGGTAAADVSKLYLNQINNGGGAMTFIDSGLIFNNRNEGSTFIDIDTDGDLDLYVNKNGLVNELWINNLTPSPQANHLYIDVIEDRDVFGLINTETRFGVGATATILDCDGNVISGIREVNGGSGHGTMEPGVIHFGLPGGPLAPIVVEISYPRTTTGRIVVREELIPANFNNGSINIVSILPTSGNQAPIANDDLISTPEDTAVNFDPLIDNGNGVDSDPDGDPFSVISITQPANGTAVLNGDGTITYTPDLNFFGSDPFTYTIEDNTSCTLVNIQTIGNVIMTVTSVNDLPIATDNTADVTEDIDLTDSGNVITDDDGNGVDSDVEGANLVVVDIDGTPVLGSTSIVGTYGTLIMNPDGSYTYNLDNANAAVQGLTAADSLLECFDYTIREDEAFTTNGDFENIPGGTNTLIFNAVTANGWIASISSPDVVDPAITVGGMAYNTSPTGGNFMHLASAVTTGSVTGEEIAYNVMGLIIGNTYTVSWDQTISNGNFGGFTFVDAFFEVNIDGNTHIGNTLIMPALGTAASWEGEQFTFVAANSNVTLSFLADLPAGGNNRFSHLGLDNVHVTGADNRATAELCVTINGIDDDADLSLIKTVSDSNPNQGVDITFTITIDNSGPSATSNIVMTDVIPVEFSYTDPNFVISQGTVTFTPATRELEWDLGAYSLTVGSSITLAYTVTVDTCGTFKNQAEITASALVDPDSTPNNGG